MVFLRTKSKSNAIFLPIRSAISSTISAIVINIRSSSVINSGSNNNNNNMNNNSNSNTTGTLVDNTNSTESYMPVTMHMNTTTLSNNSNSNSNSNSKTHHQDQVDNNEVHSYDHENAFAYEDDTVMPTSRHKPPGQEESENDDDDEITSSNLTNIVCVKWSVLTVLIVTGAAVATMALVYTNSQQTKRFKDAFHHDATTFKQAFYHQHTNKLWTLFSLGAAYNSIPQPKAQPQPQASMTLTSSSSSTLTSNMTLPNFQQQTLGNWHMSDAASLFYAPVLHTIKEQTEWEQYAVQHQDEAEIIDDDIFTIHRSIQQGIYRLDTNTNPIDDDSWNNDNVNDNDTKMVKAPVWQITPPNEKRYLNMFNLYSELQRLFYILEELKVPQFGPIFDQHVADYFMHGNTKTDVSSGPRSVALLPIMEDTKLVGVTGVEIDWMSYFQNVVKEGPMTLIVLENTCDQLYSYQVQDGIAQFIGTGDLHDSSYDTMAQSTTNDGVKDYWSQQQFSQPILPTDHAEYSGEPGLCLYKITIYPTDSYEATFYTGIAITYTLVAVAMTVLSIGLFCLYGVMVDRRQREVLNSAAKSNAIIKSLFPAVVRDRLFEKSSSHHQGSGGVRSSLSKNPLARRLTMNRVSNHNNSVPTGDLDENPKARLTNFLRHDIYALEHQEDEPIAEMFSNTTVMFADIAGFTAWSSEREPSQVFKLLETLYHEFDTIAKRLDVFKVETIGDCYVAVSGLPEPNKDHAKIMARFAYEILLSTNHLTQQLEAVLGPGTSDLGLRIGLHSGPVTAGVLRGAKSRFQLFGDTMNTASRIESTGQAGHIQASQETAELISKAGKDYWLTKREGTITAKGKGELQTYWVMICRAPSKPVVVPNDTAEHPDAPLVVESESEGEEEEEDFDQPVMPLPPPQALRDSRVWGQMSMDGGESVTSRYSFTIKEDRLIDWNVEVLMSFLEKVVQHRLVTETKNLRFGKSSKNESPFGTNRGSLEDRESGLIIDEVAEVITLPKFNSRYKPPPACSRLLPPEIRYQMKEFVASIASMYRDVPFHNFEHASHVTMSANKLIKRIVTPAEDASKYESDLHFSTFGISSDPLTQFAVVFSALIHDVDHTGLPNSQLVKEQSTIARIFNNKSVAEQNSVVVAWELLMEPRFSDLQTCIFAFESDRRRFRQLVVNAVMATDIMDRDMVTLRKKRWEKAFDPSLSNDTFLLDVDVNRKATIVIEHIIQASDVAHTMQHWHIFIKWNTKLYRELHQAYINGHANEDPSEGWYEGQIGFFDNYIIPLAKKLKECGVFGVSGDEYLTYAQMNRTEWEQKGREETKKMIRSRRAMAMNGSTSSGFTTGVSCTSSGFTGISIHSQNNNHPEEPEMSAGITSRRSGAHNRGVHR